MDRALTTFIRRVSLSMLPRFRAAFGYLYFILCAGQKPGGSVENLAMASVRSRRQVRWGRRSVLVVWLLARLGRQRTKNRSSAPPDSYGIVPTAGFSSTLVARRAMRDSLKRLTLQQSMREPCRS
jgi:hypothetical protein